jgi:hypothetical protein
MSSLELTGPDIGRLHKQTLKFNSDEAEINSFVGVWSSDDC